MKNRKMEKGDLELFRLYLKYGEPRISNKEMASLDRDEFNTLKRYFFGHKEGYTLDASYDDFMEYLKGRCKK